MGVPTRVIQNVSVGIQPTGAHTKQTILRNCGLSFYPCLKLIAKIFCAVEIAKTSAVSGNRHWVFVSIYGIPTLLCSSE